MLLHGGLLIATACLLGACDRHSADEVPENYGHGSSHDKRAGTHQTDSRNDSTHFSDTQGLAPERDSDAQKRETASPSPTPGGHFF